MDGKEKCNIKLNQLFNVTEMSRKCRASNVLHETLSAPMRALISSDLHLSCSSYPSAGYITAILVMGLSYSPVRVLTFTLLTFPSCPRETLTARPIFHVPRIALEVCTITKSSTRTLRFSACHFFLGSSDRKTSLVQRVQNESTIFWTNSTQKFMFTISQPLI